VSPPAEGAAGPPVLSMREAVARFVPDGQELLIGGFAYGDPLAFAHELIRQGRRGLGVTKTSGGVLVDQLIGAGCVESLLLCHVWNSVGPEAAHCFRRAVEHQRPHAVAIEEMSYGAMTMALLAGACDLPFMPTTPVRGTGHYDHRSFRPEKFGLVRSPFDARDVVVVSPLRPALGVFHVQRADALGNAQAFGPTAELRYAIASCERVIVIAEALVDTEVVRSRPELTVAPGFMVDAIVVEPWAAHPTDSSGDYLRDLEHHVHYGECSRTEAGFERYVQEWILETGDHAGFIAKLGAARLDELRV
jgi:glutaconate CoA-transferase subunit A